MKKTLLIILGIVILAYFFMVAIVTSFEATTSHKLDYIESGISRALGNKDLVLGSKLKLWVQSLGKPDLIADCGGIFDTTKLFWLKKGIGVQVDGHIDSKLNTSLNERVTLLILPVMKKTAPVLMRGCHFVGDNGKNKGEIEFEDLLDFKVNDYEIKGMKESDIQKLYENYDASNDYYYKTSFPFKKDTVRLIRYPNPDCSIACKDEINTIQIARSNMFSAQEVPRFFKRIILFPYSILKLMVGT